MQHNYVIANLRREKETSIDVLKKFYAYTAIIHSKNHYAAFIELMLARIFLPKPRSG